MKNLISTYTVNKRNPNIENRLDNVNYDIDECDPPNFCDLLGVSFSKFQPNHIYSDIIKEDAYDCQIRVISKIFNISWEESYRRLCEIGMRIGTIPNHNLTLEAILSENGFRKIYSISDVLEPINLCDFLYDARFKRGKYVIVIFGPLMFLLILMVLYMIQINTCL